MTVNDYNMRSFSQLSLLANGYIQLRHGGQVHGSGKKVHSATDGSTDPELAGLSFKVAPRGQTMTVQYGGRLAMQIAVPTTSFRDSRKENRMSNNTTFKIGALTSFVAGVLAMAPFGAMAAEAAPSALPKGAAFPGMGQPRNNFV